MAVFMAIPVILVLGGRHGASSISYRRTGAIALDYADDNRLVQLQLAMMYR